MSEADIDPYHMPDEYTKVEKGTKSKSFARRAIGYLPTVAGGALGVANAANALGVVQNPQLKAALETANAIRKYAPLAKSMMGMKRHSLRKESSGY